MITSIVMSVVSLGLFIYWLRYTCQLILSAQATRDYTKDVAAANDLRFLQVLDELGRDTASADLDKLRSKLADDYRLLSYLLGHGPSFHEMSDRLEQRMLMVNFHLLQAYCAAASRVSVLRRKWPVQEMAQVVGYLANRMGERSAYAAAYR
jgi:hypothetical protein